MSCLFSAAAQSWVTNNPKPLLDLLKLTPDEQKKRCDWSFRRELHPVSAAAIHPKALWDIGPHVAFIKDHALTAAQQTSTSVERRGPTCIKVGAQKRQNEGVGGIKCPGFLGML